MEGGNYRLNQEFLKDVYLPAIDSFTPERPGNLVFKSPSKKPQPIFVDLDIEVASLDVQIPVKAYVRFAERVVELVHASAEFVIAKRPKTYHKVSRTKNCFRGGCHIYILGRFTLAQAVGLRSRVLQELVLKDFFPEALNSFDDVFDKNVSERSNGLVLIGGLKKNGVPPYYICYRGFCGGGGVLDLGWHKEKKREFSELFLKIYEFLWDPYPGNTATPQPAPTPTPKPATPTHTTHERFNLKAFLACSEGFIPDNTKYKQFCAYFARVGLDPEHTALQCNSAWKPSDNTETARLMRCMGREARVSKASLIMWLKEIGCTDFVAVWPTPPQFYNESGRFGQGVWWTSEVSQYLKLAVVYVSSVKQYVWRYYTRVIDKHDHVIKNVSMSISSNPPFFKSDDFSVSTKMTRAELLQDVGERIKTGGDNIGELLDLNQKLLKTKTSAQAYELLPQNSTRSMSKIFRQLHMAREIPRKIAITFKPFISRDTTSPEVFNTFTGFHLASCQPFRVIDFKTTFAYEYLVKVFGFGEEDHAQLVYLLDFIAYTLQHPARRSGRIIMVVSNKDESEGTGKSFLFNILEVIFRGYTIFLDSIDLYLQRFNSSMGSKKVIWLDDIYGATLNQTRKLFPKVTCSKQTYEKKGESVITLPEYSELWITSNQSAPLFIKPGDRRQLIFKASELLQENIAFFSKTATQLEEIDVQHSVFQFFLNRDVSKFTTNSNPRTTTKNDTIERCMNKTHRFFATFFHEDDWATGYRPDRFGLPEWVSQFTVFTRTKNPRRGETCLRISTSRLYTLYKSFMRDKFPSSSVRDSDTFFREAERVGVHKSPGRQKIRSRCTVVCDIYWSDWADAMAKLYPGKTLEPFAHHDPKFVTELEKSATCGWMD